MRFQIARHRWPIRYLDAVDMRREIESMRSSFAPDTRLVFFLANMDTQGLSAVVLRFLASRNRVRTTPLRSRCYGDFGQFMSVELRRPHLEHYVAT